MDKLWCVCFMCFDEIDFAEGKFYEDKFTTFLLHSINLGEYVCVGLWNITYHFNENFITRCTESFVKMTFPY